MEEYRQAQLTGLTPEKVEGEKNILRKKRKEQAGIITKTLDAQVSKRQQFAEAERKQRIDLESRMIEENDKYMETRKSQQKEWKEKAKMAFDKDRER